MIGRLLCKFRPHVWRKARKNEDQAKKYCKRGCGASEVVKKRTPKETT